MTHFTANKPKTKRPGPLKRGLRFVAACLSAAIALAIVLAVTVYARLAAGPLDLAAYLPEISAAVSDRLPGARLELKSAEIALTENGGARLVVRDATLVDDETGPFAHVPRATGAFRLRDLARGVIDPSNVELSGVEAKLVRSPAGVFSFGFAGAAGGGEAEGADAFRRLLSAIGEGESGVQGAAPEARGQILQLTNARITYVDRFSGRNFASDDARILIWRASDGIYSNASLTFDDGFGEPTSANLSGRRFDTGVTELSASFRNASPKDLADQITALDWLEAFAVQVDGELRLALTAEGDVTKLSGALRGGAGELRLGGGVVEPVTATELTYSFEPEAERFQIGGVSIRSDRLKIDGEGFVQVNRDEDDEVSDIVAQLDFSDIRAAAPEYLDEPLEYETASFTGRLTPEPFMVEIGEARMTRGRMNLSAAGRLWRENEEWRADVTARGADFTLAEMLGHWPRQAAPGALSWMRENMTAARVLEADAFARLGGGEDEMKIDFSFEGAEGSYLAPMPPIRRGVGAGQVDLQYFTLSLDEGFVAVGDAGEISLAGSSFVTDIVHPRSPSKAIITAVGPTAAALALIDEDPLNLTRALGVPLGDVGGVAEVRAVAEFPLLKDLLLDDVNVSADAVLTDVALVAPGIGLPVAADRLTMKADTSGFSIEGDAALKGVPATISWKEAFSPSARRIDVRTRLTSARLETLGFPQPWLTGGAVDITARVEPGAARTTFSLKANLKGAALEVAEIDFRKPEGGPGEAAISGVFEAGALSLNAIDVASPDLTFRGAARFGEDGAPRWVRADRLTYRDAIDLSLTAERRKVRWVIDASGPLVDLSRLVDGASADADFSDAPGGTRDKRIAYLANLDIDLLKANDEQFFRDVKGSIAQTHRSATTIRLTGSVRDGGPVKFDYQRDVEGGSVRLRAENAGRFLRDAGIFDDGAGGELLIRGDIAPGAALSISGEALVRDIVIHDDAKLSQLLSGAELAELQKMMRKDGIVFSTIRAPFELDAKRVRLSRAVAKGAAIGVSVSGDYSLGSGALDFDGVFTPVYALNSALGRIPLLGKVLTGGDGQGLFAFNFAVRGDADDPKVSVNPLSVLMPGIFRNVLSGRTLEDDVDAAFDKDASANTKR